MEEERHSCWEYTYRERQLAQGYCSRKDIQHHDVKEGVGARNRSVSPSVQGFQGHYRSCLFDTLYRIMNDRQSIWICHFRREATIRIKVHSTWKLFFRFSTFDTCLTCGPRFSPLNCGDRTGCMAITRHLSKSKITIVFA
mgnify:CR=1 FL=1